MMFGAIAAAGWGLSTIAATYASRRIGTYAAVLASQLVGAAILGVLAVIIRPPLADLSRGTILWLVAAGGLSLTGWLTYYRALESGPVGLVSALASTYGGVAAALAVLTLGEHLRPAGAAGIVLAVAGVCMAAARSPGLLAAGAASRNGIMLALASALTYGVFSCLLGGYAAHAGWLAAALITYGTSAAALIVVLPFRLMARSRSAVPAPQASFGAGTGLQQVPQPVHHDRLAGDRGDPRPAAPRPLHHDRPAGDRGDPALLPLLPGGAAALAPSHSPGFAWAAGAGLTEAAALAAISLGGQAGQVAVTAAVSSVYPAIPLAAGLLLFREHLSRRQVLGVALIITGLVLVSLG